jgi:single-strand DNA-binding protein
VNRITLTGRLTRDPELRQLPSGEQVCCLRLAVDGMQPSNETGYIDVVSFGKPAEAAAAHLTKGWLVAVDGRLQQRDYQAKGGEKRTAWEIVGRVEFLTAPRGTSEPSPAANGTAAVAA